MSFNKQSFRRIIRDYIAECDLDLKTFQECKDRIERSILECGQGDDEHAKVAFEALTQINLSIVRMTAVRFSYETQLALVESQSDN